jgi:hypothetical protein
MTKRDKNRIHNQMYRTRKKQERSTGFNPQHTVSDDDDTCDEDTAEAVRSNLDIPEHHEHPAILQSEYTTAESTIQLAAQYGHANADSAEEEIQPPLMKRQRSNLQHSNQQPHSAGSPQDHPATQRTECSTVESITQPEVQYAYGNGESSGRGIQLSPMMPPQSNLQQSSQVSNHCQVKSAAAKSAATKSAAVKSAAVKLAATKSAATKSAAVKSAAAAAKKSTAIKSSQQSLSTKEKNRLRQQQCRSQKKQGNNTAITQPMRQKKGRQHFQGPVDLEQINSATDVQLPRQKKMKHHVQLPDDIAYDISHALVVGTHAQIEVSSFQYPENDLNYTLKTAANFQKMFSEHLPTGICAVCARRTGTCDMIMHTINNFPHLSLLSCARPNDEDVDAYPRHALTRCKVKDLEYCLDSNGVQGNCYNHNILHDATLYIELSNHELSTTYSIAMHFHITFSELIPRLEIS